MPCHAAASVKIVAVSPDETVEDVLAKMKKQKSDIAVVTDEDDKAAGVFTVQILLKNLLPVSVAMSDGIQLDIKVGAAPGIAKRLKKLEVVPVGDLMQRKFAFVSPEAPLWEGINLLLQYGAPLLVLDSSGIAIGAMNSQSALEELIRLKDSEE